MRKFCPKQFIYTEMPYQNCEVLCLNISSRVLRRPQWTFRSCTLDMYGYTKYTSTVAGPSPYPVSSH